ncbi:hypothetical protein [Ramlibacter sp.]|uniref:hypothetical protein n=1 Tax=Ramlibacter sp. TaxID=1917967 RepID=UPI002FC8DF1B
MRNLTVACVLVWTASAGAQEAPAPAAAAEFEQAWSDAEIQNDGAAARQYLAQWLRGTIWDDNGTKRRPVWPAEKAISECVTAVFPGPTTARMVFTLDDQGIVRTARTDQAGHVQDCVQSRVTGLRVPAPPMAPFLLCSRYEKLGEDRTLVEGCGPSRLTEICERKRNTETCSTYRR